MQPAMQVYDRKSRILIRQETVADGWMRWVYQTSSGKMALHALIKRKAVSSVYGWYCKRRASAKMAQKIIDQYHLDVTPFETPFQTYRDFFTRALPYVEMPIDSDRMGAWAEGYVSAWQQIEAKHLVQVKDSEYDLFSLLQDREWAERYDQGTMIRIRLAPQHYHHFHWFDDGVIQSIKDIKGSYYSVHPLALAEVVRLYCQNKRRIVEIKTEHFGTVLLVEVGATMIGSILNPFSVGDNVEKGKDGGYFAPGGSMILGLFEKNTIQVDGDLLSQTQMGVESVVSLGEQIAVKGKL